MFARGAIVAALLLAVGAAAAEPMSADTARRFVAGKVFAYNCFDGTRGAGRIFADGSVAGTMQSGSNGPVRYLALPPGTLHVKGQNVCASVRGMLLQPCFNLDRKDDYSFRGSVSGLGFAYCDFTRRPVRPSIVRSTWRPNPAKPLPIHAEANAAGGQ